ncbi:UvrD-helicase domain-containing protein [Tabrizicola sp. J26]|uniref:UvrD-helicase domain-containing protein n=1 Tax=Alitabrizicola rongguiensis TaxID=2909234 RepID=UPI001F26A034|nr:UvrD-helicase domain-containing protein [Tabrizicola rongguiensis]MCF1708698.1 UvrD-helicase domain-containing protein [Tabrizicola rongguiensis]
MKQGITLVPAGAGSGKTHRIETELTALVTSGVIRAERILAVTFTESAADELKGRLRGSLMAAGRIEDALAIDRAYVGTIHGLGLRLLTEHAFATGRNPSLRLLSEAERDLLLRQEMGHGEALRPVRENLGRFAYAWDRQTGRSAEEQFRSKVIATIDLLRGLGPRGLDPEIVRDAEAELRRRYGPCLADPQAATARLSDAVHALMCAFPKCLTVPKNVTANRDFRANFDSLRKASHSPDLLTQDWELWQKLRNLRQSKRGCPTPDGYDALADEVMAAAAVLPSHPGPLEDACIHLRALVCGAQEVMAVYAQAKVSAGLIDYADMISDTEAILREQPDLLNAVIGEIDCVVIDEFQDTNPVQFAMLWRLARHAPRCLIVGDTKQSIMGFQGADPRLSEALNRALPESLDPQRENWRSTPPVMELVNALGQSLFDEAYVSLAATRSDPGLPWLEVVEVPGSRSKAGKPQDAIAARVAAMIADGEPVVDRKTRQIRPVRPDDIAILCYRHDRAQAQADVLRSLGLPVRIQGDGWRECLAVRVAGHALIFAADPHDAHAALAFLTLGPPHVPIEEALRQSISGDLLVHPGLDPLRLINPNLLSLADLAIKAVCAAGLWDWAAGLPDPRSARADLCRFLAEAQAFDELAPEITAAAGFHGRRAKTFLGWLDAQSEKAFNRRPDPDGWSSDGIEIVTWHAAKGREWPVVVVAELEYDWSERGNSLRAEFEGFEDIDNVLDHAELEFTPHFAAKEQTAAFKSAREDACRSEAHRLLYVAMTRARDRLVIALPPEPREPRTDFATILRSQCGLKNEEDGVWLGGKRFTARVTALPSVTPAMDDGQTRAATAGSTLFAERRAPIVTGRTPLRVAPSSLATKAPATPVRTIFLGCRVGGTPDGFSTATDRGTAWHLAFRVLSQRPDLASRLTASTGLDANTIKAIAAQAAAVTGWLGGQGFAELAFEVPIQVKDASGSEINGIIDCLASGPAGMLIVDHKSGPAPDPAARFEDYRAQLMSYAAALQGLQPDRPVLGVLINWMNEGMVTHCELTGSSAVREDA